MAKDPALGIRLEPDEREALDRAAKADERALSAMGRKILVEWLRTNGWLAERRPMSEVGDVGKSKQVKPAALKSGGIAKAGRAKPVAPPVAKARPGGRSSRAE